MNLNVEIGAFAKSFEMKPNKMTVSKELVSEGGEQLRFWLITGLMNFFVPKEKRN